jgi:A/G-specific adenine glycosylase
MIPKTVQKTNFLMIQNSSVRRVQPLTSLSAATDAVTQFKTTNEAARLRFATMSVADRDELLSELAMRVRRPLLEWFDESQRDLPWRLSRDAYSVWVSEIMCQQTQVATVIPYFERWMAAFPTVDDLATADLDDVLTYWAGLGYYRRARFLHRAAKVVQCDGLPNSFAEWLKLPGVGRYTAGAIASIAHGEVVPVVDGNVDRVLSRILCVGTEASASVREKRIWKIATALVDDRRPGDFNQSLMELGATVCTPRSPNCQECPISSACDAFASDNVANFPPPKKRTKSRNQTTSLFVLRHEGRVGLVQRPSEGLHGGLWEFPSLPGGEPDVSGLFALHGVEVSSPRLLGEFPHVFSHIQMTYRVFSADLRKGVAQLRWVDDVFSLPVSAAMRKAVAIADTV